MSRFSIEKMKTPFEQLIDQLEGRKVQGVLYPMAHRGAIWHVYAADGELYPWELVKFEKVGNVPISNGWAYSLREANEVMNAIMQLWVMYGNDYTADKAGPPVSEPPKPPMGFQLPNR